MPGTTFWNRAAGSSLWPQAYKAHMRKGTKGWAKENSIRKYTAIPYTKKARERLLR
jgi:hypothetical protein